MARWCILTATVSLACVIPAIALAQSGPPYASGVEPAGWKSPRPMGGYATPHGHPELGPVPQAGAMVYQEIPETRLIYDESPVERALANIFRHAYFRVDYLLWDISDPGDTLLGAQSADDSFDPAPRIAIEDPTGGTTITITDDPTSDPRTPFVYSDPNTNTQVIGVVPSLRGVSTNENNGIRATFGLPNFAGGTFEGSIFALQTASAPVPINTFNQAIVDSATGTGNQVTTAKNVLTDIVQPVLLNGNPQNIEEAIRYEVDYTTDPINGTYRWGATLQTSVWGSDAAYIFDAWDPGADLVVRPLVGFRYLNFSEELRQQGNRDVTVTVDDENVDVTAFDKLDSSTINNLYGPQFGVRFETTRKWLTLGVQPRVLLGLNTYNAKVQQSVKLIPDLDPVTGAPVVSRALLADQEEYRSLRDRQSTFGVVGDVEAFTRVRFNDHLALYCSYNLLWTGLITRPADNIVYNKTLVDGIPANDFGLDVDFSGAILQGLSVGGEISY